MTTFLPLTTRMIIPQHSVLYLEGDRNYTFVVLQDGRKHLLSKTLGVVLSNVSDGSFLRISKSHAINLQYLHSIDKSQLYPSVKLTDGKVLTISRRKLNEVKPFLNL